MAERLRTSISSFIGLIFIITPGWLCLSLFLTLELPAILKIMRAVFDYFTSYTEVINLLQI